MKFCTLHQILIPVAVTSQKIEIFGVQDGGGRHLEIRFFGHNSSTDCPYSSKFCMRKHIGMPTKATMIKTASFQNPRRRTAAILKIVKLPYTSENIVGF